MFPPATARPSPFFRVTRQLGGLTRIESYSSNEGIALDQMRDLVLSPDGNHLYAVDEGQEILFTSTETRADRGVDRHGKPRGRRGGRARPGQHSSAAVSPDGAFVYAISNDDSRLGVFSRDASTGQLTQVQVLQDNTGGVDGFSHLTAIVMSPEGRHVYVTAEYDRSAVAFERNPLDGTLTYLGYVRDGENGVDGLYYANHLAISSDGMSVYVLSYLEHSLAVFRRDPAGGSLEFVEVFKDGTGGVDGLEYPYFVAVSPDGNQVYVLSYHDDSLTVWTRNASDGKLTFSQRLQDGDIGVDGLNNPLSVFSPDGEDLYVAGHYDHAIARFSRNPSSGSLTYVEKVQDGVGGADGLQNVAHLVMSPTGSHLYATASDTYYGSLGNDRSVAAFARDTETGALTFLQVFHDDVDGVQDLHGAVHAVMAPDGRHLYVSGRFEDALVLFGRDAGPEIQPLAHTVQVPQDQTVENVDFGNRHLPPEVVSIELNDPNPTELAQVRFTVTFTSR